MDSKAATSGSRVAEIFECAGNAFNKLAGLTMSLHEDQLLIEADASNGNCKWSTAEITKLKNAINRFGIDLSKIAENIESKSINQIKQKMRSKAFQEANLGEPPTVPSSATESLADESQKDNEEYIKDEMPPPASDPIEVKEESKGTLPPSLLKSFTPGKSLIGGNIIVSRRKTVPVTTSRADTDDKEEEDDSEADSYCMDKNRKPSNLVKYPNTSPNKDRRKQILKRMPEQRSANDYTDSEEDYEPPRSFQDASPPKKMPRIQQVNFEEEEEVYYDDEDEEEIDEEYEEDNGFYGEDWQEGEGNEYPSEEDEEEHGDYELPDEDGDEDDEYFDEDAH